MAVPSTPVLARRRSVIDRFYPVVPTADWSRACRLVRGSSSCASDQPESEAWRQVARRRRCARHAAQLIVNDYWQVAIDEKCPWVHLGQEDLVERHCRDPPPAVLGVSTHDHAELGQSSGGRSRHTWRWDRSIRRCSRRCRSRRGPGPDRRVEEAGRQEAAGRHRWPDARTRAALPEGRGGPPRPSGDIVNNVDPIAQAGRWIAETRLPHERPLRPSDRAGRRRRRRTGSLAAASVLVVGAGSAVRCCSASCRRGCRANDRLSITMWPRRAISIASRSMACPTSASRRRRRRAALCVQSGGRDRGQGRAADAAECRR